MKSSHMTSQAGRSSTSQRTVRRRIMLAVAAVIVGLVVAELQWGALARPSQDGAEPDREVSQRGPSPTEQHRAARPALPPALPTAQPALPAEPAPPAEPTPVHRHLPTSVARQLTELKVQKYVHEAYPAWRQAHPGQECPQQLIELNAYMDEKDAKDAWGRPLKMFCNATRPAGAKRIKVFSLGRDAERGTEDDIMAEE
jgi:hypothetical protein